MNRKPPIVERKRNFNSRPVQTTPQQDLPNVFTPHKGQVVTVRMRSIEITGSLSDVDKTFLTLTECEVFEKDRDNTVVASSKWEKVMVNRHSLPIFMVGSKH